VKNGGREWRRRRRRTAHQVAEEALGNGQGLLAIELEQINRHNLTNNVK